ncbi:DUF309 domain-containing protein [Desulfobaculum sp.]
MPMTSEYCAGAPSPELERGVAEFNTGRYYDCHETLEDLWRGDQTPHRDLYKGMLQVGVALYHLERGGRRGPLRLLRRAQELLRPFAPVCHGYDIARLVADARDCQRVVEGLSEEASVPGRVFTLRIHRAGVDD